MYIFAIIIHRGVEQLVARRAHNPKVGGSSPLPATIENGLLKQVVRFCFIILKLYSV